MKGSYSKISLLFLLIIAIIGSLLRAQMFLSIRIKYTNLLHSHSHVAFQGWIYTILFLLLTTSYLKESQILRGRYSLQFKLSVLTILCILLTFAYQGYGVYSIIFSTLFQLLNYWFVFRFLKDTKELKSDGQSISIRFIRTGLGFGVLSTIIPFIIGFISAKGMMGTEIYRTFVFTFLHLQYNGWFLFVVFGLFFKLLENKSIAINIKSGRIFYWLSALNVIPSISLSLLGMSYYPTIAFIGILSSTLLFASIIYYGRSFSIKNLLNKDANSVWSKTFLLIFLTSFILKTLLQSLSIIDSLTNIVFNNRWIIIAYLHLTMIGMFSFFFIYYMVEKTWIRITSLSKNGFITLILGFVSSECLMIAIGLTNANLYIPLLISSIMMAIGILLVLLTPIITCETSHAIFDNKKK